MVTARFSPAADYATGNIPVAVTVADFNGDGIPDLAVVNYGFGTSNTVSLLLGNGDGTFRSGGALVTGIGPVQAAAADFDGNGATDLAVATSTGISVILGRGAGVFGPRTDYPIAGGASAIAVGDFNGDGKPDLAVTTLAGSVVVLLGNGDGTFQAGVSYALNSVTDADAILVGDFSGDGKPDLLVGKSTNAVSILVGNGDGTFQPAVDIPLGKAERGWAAGDFDGDGALDVAAASVGLNAVFVILNPPVVALYPAGLNFGGQLTGTTSAPAAVTVSNPSGAPLRDLRRYGEWPLLGDQRVSGNACFRLNLYRKRILLAPCGGQCRRRAYHYRQRLRRFAERAPPGHRDGRAGSFGFCLELDLLSAKRGNQQRCSERATDQ